MSHLKVGRPVQPRAPIDGDALREARIRKNLSAGALGRMVGAGDEVVLKWEKGRCRPSKQMVGMLARALGIARARIEL